ncbi:unnamed protein product [Absidia cylindrospora]
MKHKHRYTNKAEVPAYEKKREDESDEKKRCRAQNLCFHCKKDWVYGHKCQEYLDQRATRSNNMKMRATERRAAVNDAEDTTPTPLSITAQQEFADDSDQECSTREGRITYMARKQEEIKSPIFIQVMVDVD